MVESFPVTAADLDLRLVRYFTVVAEHLSFGRAADELRVAQPSLSRQVRRLEEQLGVRLLERSPRGSALTPAGRAFLPRAGELLGVAGVAVREAREADAPARELVVGAVADLVATPVARELRRAHPGAEVRVRHLTWQSTGALGRGRVDALLTRLPVPGEGVRVSVLREEPWVALLPAAHRLAGREVVRVEDFPGAELTPCAMTAAIWVGPAGSAPPVGVEDSFEDKVELVADGGGVVLVPSGDRRVTARDDLVVVPVAGIAPSRVVAVTRAADRNPLAGAFHEVARRVLGG
ncbi:MULTISPECIES: LysR family transcriptional regulator [Actinosynnema]|uniref:LysR family transcriptional regulator n=1 Tax=Actinosynnema TaxID=40566 RepID=UPI0020A57C92|nr:LysR family transcriptional regulator [Actinosynnema pretiosum]MCP2096485.1 DNA-binding transcriptional regulator, LysR family [Actinosynnema pretiosum]